MASRFTGQIAVITGAARGIGFAIAERLSREGAKVAVFDIDAAAAQAAAKKLPNAVGFAVDVRNKDSVARAFSDVQTKLGAAHILVNAAGITGRTAIKCAQVDPDDWDNVFAVNSRGTFLTCRAALPAMEKMNYGRIVNIASISGKEGNAGMAAYSSSKAAVIGFTKVVGKEYAETGITCNAIAPAVVQTEMVAALPKEQVEYMTSKIPMKRTGALEELASLAAFIASKEASFTTAFTFDASGGRATY